MEEFQGFFKIQSGHKGTNAPSTPQPSLSPWPLSSLVPSPGGSLLRASAQIESHPDTSLIQKIAARFVPSSASESQNDVTDGSATPRSRGGNPVHHRPLIANFTDRLGRQPAYFESQNEKPMEGKATVKCSSSTLSVMILLWLINQRQILKDLTDIRSSSLKEQKVLQKHQESIHNHIDNLGHELRNLHTVIQTQHQQVKSEMAFMRKLMTAFGLFHLVVMVTFLFWSNKTVRRIYYNCFRQMYKAVVRPTVSVFHHWKNISQIFAYECSDTINRYKDLLSYWR